MGRMPCHSGKRHWNPGQNISPFVASLDAKSDSAGLLARSPNLPHPDNRRHHGAPCPPSRVCRWGIAEPFNQSSARGDGPRSPPLTAPIRAQPPSGKRSGKKTAALPSAIKPTIAKAETHDMFEVRCLPQGCPALDRASRALNAPLLA